MKREEEDSGEGERWIRMDGGTVNLLSLDCTNYGS